MPRSIKNTTPTPISVTPAPIVEPTPLIMLQPHGDDVQFNAYGLEIADIVNALRLAIVHVVGKPDGITVIDEVMSRSQRVWVRKGPAAKPRIVPSSNGKKRGRPAVKQLLSFEAEPDVNPYLAAELDEIDRERA